MFGAIEDADFFCRTMRHILLSNFSMALNYLSLMEYEIPLQYNYSHIHPNEGWDYRLVLL